MRKISKITAMIFLTVLGGTAIAAVPGSYFGGGIGVGKLETPNQNIVNGAAGKGLKQSKEIGGLNERVFAGYNFNRYFGYELGLAHYAQSKYQSGLGPAQASLDYNLNAADIVAKAYLPFGESGFNLYGLGGVALVHSTVSYNVHVGNLKLMKGEKTQNKLRPIYGIGASYDIPQTKFSTALELSRIQGKGNVKKSTTAIPNADMLTFNIAYNFD